MKIVVIGNPEGWYARDLRRVAAARHDICVVEHRNLTAHLSNTVSTVNNALNELSAADAVLVRTMDAGSLEQVVFRMDALGELCRAGAVVVNSPRAVEAAVDKYLAAAKCQAAGLTVPPTSVCQNTEDAMTAFEALGEDVVVKPLFGGEGRGIFRVEDRDAAYRAFRMLRQLNSVIYLQRFIPNGGYDTRLFVVGRRVMGMRRSNPHDWRSNISRGAVAEAVEISPPMAEIAIRAAAAVGCEIAGVDLLHGEDGTEYVLEVNAVPGWKALARTTNCDVAAMVLEHLENLVAEKGTGV